VRSRHGGLEPIVMVATVMADDGRSLSSLSVLPRSQAALR
jgi:hypothetical protein